MQEAVISFTPAQLYGVIISICGFITAVAAVVAIFVKINKSAKEPDRIRDERLTSIENRLQRHDEILDRDNNRLEDLEQSARLTNRSLLCLLKHSLDGNNISDMEKVQADLEKYLINR